MIQPRWKKVLSDLWSNKARTILVVLSIMVGVFAVGTVSHVYIIMSHDLDADYLSANPYSGYNYSYLFDDTLVGNIRRIPGVENAEGRSSYSGRVQGLLGQWYPISFTMLPSLNDMNINTLKPLSGPLPTSLREGDILLDHTSLGLLPVKVGDTVQVELPDKRKRPLRVAAIVHDPTGYSTALSGYVNAYIGKSTMKNMSGYDMYDQMYFTVSEKKTDEAHVKNIAQLIAKKMEKSGATVFATVVMRPGEHPVKSVLQTLLVMMGIFGVLTVFLSAFLVINTINSLLTQHVRQIGVMKAVGANSAQVMGMYIALVLGFGLLALLIVIPLSALVSYILISGMSSVLNFMPSGYHIPLQTLLLEIVIALGLPVLAALVPVLHGTRITIREAISSYGLGKGHFGQSRIDQFLEKIRGLPRPLLISLRNTFRRKARLLLTLSTLTLAGAIFIGVFSVRSSFQLTINETLGYFLSDINLNLTRTHRINQVEQILRTIPGVDRIEAWGISSAKVLSEDKATAVEAIIWAPPSDSTLIEPVITEGRWLRPDDQNAIVIGNHFLNERPNTKVGDQIITKIEEKEYTWTVVGIFKMAGTVIPPFLYANGEYLYRLLDDVGDGYSFRLTVSPRDTATENRVARDIESTLNLAGIQVGDITTGTEQRAQQMTSINILVYALLIMAILIALVGGLGLMGTMGMNVIERTREIGVMRAVGASNLSIFAIVVVEGVLIGIISWLLGIIVSIPISLLLNTLVGVAFIFVPLKFVFGVDGLIVWLIVVIVISVLASLLPARNAVRLTVRDVLSYE